MKLQSVFKLTLVSLLVFSLTTLFYQNSQATTPGLNSQLDTVDYATLYESNTEAAVRKDNCDKPSQSAGDKCTADKK